MSDAMNRTAHLRLAMLVGLSALGCGAAGSMRASGDAGDTGDTEADGDGDGSAGTDDGEDPGEFGAEQTYELRLNEDPVPPLTLQMNQAEVAELFGDKADEVLLLELDSTPLLAHTLDQIKMACGDAWQIDDPDPQHDCSLTPLGQSFQGPDGTWRTSPEYSMVRLLTMTPANVVVAGTSSEGLQELADTLSNLGIIDDYGQILSDALGIPRTAPVVSTPSLVEAFQTHFVGSHPNVGPEAKLSFTLGDALSNLATLVDRYGPMDGHPGVVDPAFPVYGEVFGPDFQMLAEAESNLRLVDGVDANVGKGFMSVVVDTTGPSYDDELEFDFNDPARFGLEGIIEDLTVDIRFRLVEYDQFVPSCTGNPPCPQNVPVAPASPTSVWARDPWLIEYNIAAAARLDYARRVYAAAYLLGSAEVLIGQGGLPPGWVQYDVLFDLGNPPEDQYLWETVLEVGQVALHDTPFSTFAEGQADVAFTLHDVPVGITGSEAAEAVRPYLQEQASDLSDFILGDYKKNNDRVDFFYRRAEDGAVYAYFVAPSDRADGDTYEYESPGFYSRSDLDPSRKESETAVPGLTDTEHEKVRLDPGETTLYFADENRDVYRARFEVSQDGSEATVHLAKKI
jgi:hypothetical protein